MRIAAACWLMAWAFVGLPWRSFTAEPSLQRVQIVPFRDGSARTHVLNVVAFVPWGAVGWGLGWSATRVVLSGAAVSTGTELLQLFSRRRYPSVSDVLLNTLGTAAGVLIASPRGFQRLRRSAGARFR